MKNIRNVKSNSTNGYLFKDLSIDIGFPFSFAKADNDKRCFIFSGIMHFFKYVSLQAQIEI